MYKGLWTSGRAWPVKEMGTGIKIGSERWETANRGGACHILSALSLLNPALKYSLVPVTVGHRNYYSQS